MIVRPLLLAALLFPGLAHAADVTVMISGGFMSSMQALAPGFEQQTGDHVVIVPGPSMGTTANAIPNRLARGEPDDVLIMVGYALDNLVKSGEAQRDSEKEVALSSIGMAVKAGSPKPDISTVDALRQTLLAAKSIAYSDSASGVYIQNEMFKKLGIEDQVKGKARMIPATPVGEFVANGEAELGFQQVAELLPVPGITFVGRLPAAVQQVTVYSAALSAHAKEPAEGRKLIDYIRSPAAAAVLEAKGLQPPP
jgi:molybdate transport system substrate-binding protein